MPKSRDAANEMREFWNVCEQWTQNLAAESSLTRYRRFPDPPPADHLAGHYDVKIPGYLHSSIDVVAEASTEEKPGSIRSCSPLLLYVSGRGSRVHVEFTWQISSRTGSTQSTMLFFCDLKNMLVAIIKSTKVHLGLA